MKIKYISAIILILGLAITLLTPKRLKTDMIFYFDVIINFMLFINLFWVIIEKKINTKLIYAILLVSILYFISSVSSNESEWGKSELRLLSFLNIKINDALLLNGILVFNIICFLIVILLELSLIIKRSLKYIR